MYSKPPWLEIPNNLGPEFLSRQVIMGATVGGIMFVFVLLFMVGMAPNNAGVGYLAESAAFLLPCVLVAFSGKWQTRTFKRILDDPDLAKPIAEFQATLPMTFAEACDHLQKQARLVSLQQVTMADPTTWGRKQGLASFRQERFWIRIYEKNGRVGTLKILLLDKGCEQPDSAYETGI